MSLGISVDLNIADVQELVRREVERRYPGMHLKGFTVSSWNTVLIDVQGDMLQEPRHAVDPRHRQLDWSGS